MKLATLQITNYKVIDDTTCVIVDPLVTALVGKNESGKSAILHALWKSRNDTGRHFDQLYDYPRGRVPTKQKETRDAATLEFKLSAAEVDALISDMPHTFEHTPTKIRYTSSYAGGTGIAHSIEFDCALKVAAGGDAIQTIRDVVRGIGKLCDRADLNTLRDAAAETTATIDDAAPLWDSATIAHLRAFNDAVKDWLQPADLSASMTAVTEPLEHLLSQAERGNPKQAVERWATRNMPTFVYFDEYSQLHPKIHLPTYVQVAAQDDPDLETRTQTALFDRSGIDPGQLVHLGRPRPKSEPEEAVYRRIEERRVLLSEASRRLTADWNRWWTEGPHTLHLEVDGEYLTLKVSDEHNDVAIPFEERSNGFRWFFSFYLIFLSESERSHKGAILLLDEPGLHLHPTLQTQLLELFERISETNQIIYTTHLPFLLDGNHLERVRTVCLTGSEPRTARVSNNVRPEGDSDTLLPLQAAVGYSIAQTLFIGKRSLIVEGITDYWFIKTLSECLSALSEDSVLSRETVVIPAGGTSRLMPLASVMFASTGVGGKSLIVLLDSDQAGKEAAGRIAKSFDKDLPFLMLGAALNLGEATIEDVIPRDDYAEAVREAGHSFRLNDDEERSATNVQALKQAFQREGLGEFGIQERAAVTLRLIGNWCKDPSGVPDATRKAAIALFEAINHRFEAIEAARSTGTE